jgi:hypothetical protein
MTEMETHGVKTKTMPCASTSIQYPVNTPQLEPSCRHPLPKAARSASTEPIQQSVV